MMYVCVLQGFMLLCGCGGQRSTLEQLPSHLCALWEEVPRLTQQCLPIKPQFISFWCLFFSHLNTGIQILKNIRNFTKSDYYYTVFIPFLSAFSLSFHPSLLPSFSESIFFSLYTFPSACSSYLPPSLIVLAVFTFLELQETCAGSSIFILFNPFLIIFVYLAKPHFSKNLIILFD